MKKKLRVALLFGGKSAEHEISLISARNIAAAMDKNKYEIVAIGIDKQGRWHIDEDARLLSDQRIASVDAARAANLAAILPGAAPTPIIRVAKPRALTRDRCGFSNPAWALWRRRHRAGNAQARQPAVRRRRRAGFRRGHGQGCDETFAARCQNTHRQVLGIRQDGENQLCQSKKNSWHAAIYQARQFRLLGRHQQSDQAGEFAGAVAEALRYDNKIIIEAFIAGREIECSVLGNEKPIASLPGEIIVNRDFYSYHAKYLDDQGSRLEIPAKLPAQTIREIRQTAVAAYQALCCEGMARVDFFLCQDQRIVVNEINTIPGFTKISMYPKMWEASGITYSALIDRLIALALERFRQEKNLRTSR